MTKKLIAFIFYFFIQSAFAQSVPPLINYQGMLTDSNGKPLANGTKKLTFNIYESADSTTPVWGPQVFPSIPVINGYFNVILGPVKTDANGVPDQGSASIIPAFGAGNRFLGITVDNGAEVRPRQQILSVPFAVNASNGVPIGTIIAQHKSLSGTPSLSYGWIECNGQILSDPQSPYDGETLPNLNWQGYFLRGGNTSGTYQSMDWKTFSLFSEYKQPYEHELTVPKSGVSHSGIYAGYWGGQVKIE